MDNDDLQQATLLVLPPGYKPEDYYMVQGSDTFPKHIARMIVLEFSHIQKSRRLEEENEKLLLQMNVEFEEFRNKLFIAGIVIWFLFVALCTVLKYYKHSHP